MSMHETAEQVVAKLRAHSLRLGAAESCTGGGFGATITAVAGASDVFEGGIISYSNAVKMGLLGVQSATLQSYGAVSEETAMEMVDGIARALCVDVAISITGIAGPGSGREKPEGRVCFGFIFPQSRFAQTVEFGAIGRNNVQAASILHVLQRILAGL